MLHYEAAFSAWDENRLAGLVAVMDDGTMTAYVHYLLVYPRYQGYVSVRGCRVFKHRSHFLKGRNGFIPGRTQEAMRSIPPTFGETGMEREEGE